MKIYTQDHSWAGCIVVVAMNETQAREIMADKFGYDPTQGKYGNYSPDAPVEEHEVIGFTYENRGDS